MSAPRKRRGGKVGKRLYGEGSVWAYQTKSGERYMAGLPLQADPEAPKGTKPKRRTKGGFETMRDASDWLRAEITAVRRGVPSPSSDGPTLGEFMSEWLDGHRVGSTTRSAYRRNFRLHIEPNIGDVPLGRLRPSTLASLYRQLEKNGMKARGREGEPLGPNTVKKVHGALSVCLQSALEDGLIANNPAQQPGAKPPSGTEVKAAQREMTVWNPDELRAFITWSNRKDPSWAHVWFLTSRTGLRRSELAGLQWDDIDLRKNRLRVRRSRVVVKEKGKAQWVETKPPKNNRSRVVDIDDDVAGMLRQLRSDVGANGLHLASRDSWVIRLPDGNECHPDILTKRWTRATELYAQEHPNEPLPHLTLHGLRHTHASHLLMGGVAAKVVQERLGHETISITLDLYTHVMPSTQAEAAQVLQRLLNG